MSFIFANVRKYCKTTIQLKHKRQGRDGLGQRPVAYSYELNHA